MALFADLVLEPDTRANQPAASAVPIGSLYCVTDEDDIVERSNGTTWDAYSPSIPPATSGYTWIEEQTPTGTAVTFSSLGSYTHLELRYSARGDTAAANVNVLLTFNADTGANYDRERDGANGSGPTASEAFAGASAVVGTIPAASATAGRSGGGTIAVYDYRGTTFDKFGVTSNAYVTGTTTGLANINQFGFFWRSTAAITSITLTLSAGNYVSGSKFTLYGLQ